MNELIIVLLIAMFVLVGYIKIKSNYNERAYNRDVRRTYREKYEPKLVCRRNKGV